MGSRELVVWECCAGAMCCVGIPSRGCEAVPKPPNPQNRRNHKKIFPTQRTGVEFGISGERGEGGGM